MKCYNFEVIRTITKAEGEITIKRKAHLDFDDDTKIINILTFEKDCKKIITEIKKAIKGNNFISVKLTTSIYESFNDCETQKDFNYWKFEDYAGEKIDEIGFYLLADERYTDSTKDIFIDFSTNFLENIANL